MTDLGRLRGFLDDLGLRAGELSLEPIGEGHSNLTYLLRHGDQSMVLRRPPHGELARSANDVVREARLLRALAGSAVPVPPVIAVCEDASVLGAPFYLMPFIEGEVLADRMPAAFDPATAPARIEDELVSTLVELHALDLEAAGLAGFGPGHGYLDRQIRRFGILLEENATRPLPALERVRDWLADNRPTESSVTLVHGDYRLGNLMFHPQRPRLQAVLDWEMATVGDPLADLGYCTAMWAQSGDGADPMLDLCPISRSPGFRGRDQIAAEYSRATGRSIDDLAWYQVLAVWKAALFLEASYGRYLAGDSTDVYFARLGSGVPALADRALALARLA